MQDIHYKTKEGHWRETHYLTYTLLSHHLDLNLQSQTAKEAPIPSNIFLQNH
jgi:hypothetical protein